ncbi:hypothetical protein ACFQJ5_09740 [Halomicroarcula sp. GCM10025324]|uniref:protein kinase domain-containing protein n=1 Tax=Haloarcula TaxID=2237 RepID=UPI0023E807E4|nr:hypothetical protein [Halomicroarcula sp. ZS-22-S1]
MSSDEPGPADPRELVADVLTAPETGRTKLPALLGLLDVGDRQVRLGAVTGLCVVADSHPGTADYLARRLLDRTDADQSLEVSLALGYLAARFPDAVDAELDAYNALSDAERDLDDLTADLGSATLHESSLGLEVGRTMALGDASGPSRTDRHPEVELDDEAEAEDEEREDDDGGGTIRGRPTGGPLAGEADWLSIVEYESPFDRLSVLAPRDRRRYCDVYRTLGTVDGSDVAVGIRLLDTPDPDGDAFRSAVAERLDDWAAVATLDNVVSLYDWGHEPYLWATTEYTDETLADRGRFAPADAAWHAERLAHAVSALHERGVVHAGIDPENVAYYGNVLEADERQPPLLDNVGSIQAYRQFTDPSTYLDPRYAAPEYYDRRFGRIDHATDLYHLGAVCYRLFTGEPPYAGEFDTVRERVIQDRPPMPSEVADVPTGVDALVGKAMGKRKLARYESVTHLTQEIRRLKESIEDDAG